MKKRFLSFLTSFALAAGMTAMPVSAEAALSPEAAALLKQIQYGSYEQYTPIPADAGIQSTDGSALPAVTAMKTWDYAGIAFTCADSDALTAAAPAAHPVVRSEGQYLGYSPSFFETDGGKNAEVFLMQPLTGYADAFANRWQGAETDGDLTEQFGSNADAVLLIASRPDNAEALVSWLCAQPGADILGVGYGTSEKNGWYDNIPPVILAAPAESCTLTKEAFGAYGKKAAPVQNSPFGYWKAELPAELTFEEAQAICAELAQNPAIAYCAHQPNFLAEDIAPESAGVELAARRHTGSGDLNGDGDMNIGDAVLLTRLITEDETLDISVLSLREADLNADGLTDARDLSRMLRMLASPGAPPDEPENDPEAQTTEPCETSGTPGNDLTTASEETSGTPGNDLTTASEETSGTPGNDLTTASDNTDEGMYTYTYTSFFPEWTLLSQETGTVTESEAAYTDTDTPAAPEPVVFRLVPHGLDFAQRSELDSTGHGLPSICWIRPGDSLTVDLTVENDPGTAGMQLYFNFDKALTFERRKNSTDAYQVNVTWNPQDYSYVWTSANGKNQTAADGALMSSFVFRVPEENGTYLLDLNYAAERPNCVRTEGGLTVPDTPFVFHGLKIVVGGETELTDAPEVSETCENTDDWPLYTYTYSCDETGEYPWDQSGEGEFCFTTDQPFLAGAEVVLEWENLCNCDVVIPTEESWQWFTDTLPDWLNAETPMLADYDFHSEYDLLLITLESRCKDAAFVWGDFVSSGINNPTVSAMFSYLDVPSDEQLPHRTARFGVVRPKDPNPPELLLSVEFCGEGSEALFAQRKAGSAPFVRRE